MNSLKVPEYGLQLEGSSTGDSSIPKQAFAISLGDNVIADMIRCARGGGDIRLSLGAHPTFIYGSQVHTIAPPPDSYPYDLYVTKPFEDTRRAEKLLHAGSLFTKPRIAAQKTQAAKTVKDADNKAKATKAKKTVSSPSSDPGTEALQKGLADADARREKIRMANNLPPNKKAATKAKGKLLSAYGSTPRSMPASPGVSSVGSPSTPLLSASQQELERVKEQRVTLVHELAVGERTLDYLQKKWSGKEEDMKSALEKVGIVDPGTKKWSLRKQYWKELDVWNYRYDTQELRQKAVDSAIRQFDKQRISASEPEWQKLLPKEDRGKGICMSRLQANIARGPPQSTPKSKKSDGGSTPKDDLSVDGDKPRTGAQSMARSSSNPLPSKPKKTGDTQVKRLLGNSKAKTAAPKASTPKTATPKTSPVKGRAAASKANGGRILSKEIIDNSDSSDDEGAPLKPKAVAKPLPKSKEVRDTVIARPRPVVREPVRAQQPAKRAREDDDSSSSSGSTPLSKRVKPKQPLPASRPKQRPLDINQNARGTGTPSSSLKSKNTSPAKSSPLASSPPTNASDLEPEAPPAPVVTKKRKAEAEARAPPNKRVSTGVSTDLLVKAHSFKVYYEKYEALHYEILKLDNPPQTKITDLRDMRERLVDMKKEIYRECPPERA